jgi:hypothetical protein
VMPDSIALAMNFEVHPGLYTSYEYSDNYFGTAHAQQSESTYQVGPSLELRGFSPTFNGDLTGRVSRSHHNRFDEEDSTEANLSSHASWYQVHQSIGIFYDYLQTRTRETLSESSGEVKRHTGGATYSRELTQRTNLSLGYDSMNEKRQAPDEDVTSRGGNIGLSYLLTPRNTVDLTCRYGTYDYEIRQDVKETDSGIAWSHIATPRLRIGLSSNYVKEDNGDLPNENRYDLRANGMYSITQYTSFSASGGLSWLVMEHQDRQTTYNMSVSLVHAVERDSLAVSVSKGYTSEFTTDRYGTYDTRTASMTWEKGLLRTLTGSTGLSIENRKPTTGTEGEEETDIVARASLSWNPVEYATTTASYGHLQTEYEGSDTERENRYRMVVEVRY